MSQAVFFLKIRVNISIFVCNRVINSVHRLGKNSLGQSGHITHIPADAIQYSMFFILSLQQVPPVSVRQHIVFPGGLLIYAESQQDEYRCDPGPILTCRTVKARGVPKAD